MGMGMQELNGDELASIGRYLDPRSSLRLAATSRGVRNLSLAMLQDQYKKIFGNPGSYRIDSVQVLSLVMATVYKKTPAPIKVNPLIHPRISWINSFWTNRTDKNAYRIVHLAAQSLESSEALSIRQHQRRLLSYALLRRLALHYEKSRCRLLPCSFKIIPPIEEVSLRTFATIGKAGRRVILAFHQISDQHGRIRSCWGYRFRVGIFPSDEKYPSVIRLPYFELHRRFPTGNPKWDRPEYRVCYKSLLQKNPHGTLKIKLAAELGQKKQNFGKPLLRPGSTLIPDSWSVKRRPTLGLLLCPWLADSTNDHEE